MKRLEQARKAKSAKSAPTEGDAAPAAAGAEPTPAAGGAAEGAAAAPVPTAIQAAARTTPQPEPTEAPARAVPASSEAGDIPPKIQTVVKPVYPSFALRARIRGIVILRVLVGETGTPLDVEVLRGVSGGLTEAAVDAVRRWKFLPGRHNGVPVRAWTTVPIPFEP
jgi:periplasmic protein TonB